MKRLDDNLQRLLQAAAQAPEPVGPVPYAVEAAVMGRWRPGRTEDDFADLMALFRRAVVCATLLCAGLTIASSLVWNQQEPPGPAASAVALANFEIKSHLPP